MAGSIIWGSLTAKSPRHCRGLTPQVGLTRLEASHNCADLGQAEVRCNPSLSEPKSFLMDDGDNAPAFFICSGHESADRAEGGATPA